MAALFGPHEPFLVTVKRRKLGLAWKHHQARLTVQDCAAENDKERSPPRFT
ncbi:hypothetical protein DPMN_165485 [Dreissena polymorpha]|uniref:Uncharacterized protein n=1 Tax=Dreissena polymorpha TaxID=45954 RepID=A0A9D4EZR6_DREPO|nr:hypothetical protein DPMN_165485 [Dreissena polymorpha]